jgi:gpW protein
MSGYYGGGCYQPFDITQTPLVGVPTATLQLWLAQAQAALQNFMIGGNPISLSYTQGDGSRSVTRNITSAAALQNWIGLLNMALGNTPRVRRPIRPYFR